MKIAIRYYTKSGNTKKLADAIAGELNTAALPISDKLTEDVDILFLGSSVYAAGVDEYVKKFISDLDVHVGKVVCFSTAAILKSTYGQVKKLVNAKGMVVSDMEYHCRGSFGPLHKGRPDEKDIREIKKFAREVAAD